MRFLLLSLVFCVSQAFAAPLGELGGRLREAMPLLAPELVSVRSPSGRLPLVVPAALDLTKSAILLDRVDKEELIAPSRSQDARELIGSINAALKDFTSGALKNMPEEDLQRLASLILEKPGARMAGGFALVAEARAKNVLALRGKPLRETLHNPGHTETHPDEITVSGVPEPVRRLDAKGLIFRHYTTPEGAAAILRSNTLWNGFVPYVQLAPAVYRKSFEDITGLFLTLPGVSGRRVGVPAAAGYTSYVDVLLPKGLPVLEIEPNLFVVPLPARTREWMLDYYLAWIRGEKIPAMHAKTVVETESEGGPGPNLAVPVEIVRRGRAR